MKKLLYSFLFILTIIFIVGCDFNVSNGPTDSLEVKELSEVYVGDEFSLDVKSLSAYHITTNNPELFAINGYKITALNEGKGIIVISNNEETVEIEITILPKIIIALVDQLTLNINDEVDLNDYFETDGQISFYINNNIVLNLEASILKALKAGNAIVTAKAVLGSMMAEAQIKVNILQSSTPTITTSSFDNDLVVGDSEKIIVETTTQNDSFTYSSSNLNVLTIDADGTYHALQEGTTTVTIVSNVTSAQVVKQVKVIYEWPVDNVESDAVYLGILNYGTVTNSQMASFKYRFSIDGTVKSFTMTKVGNYDLQNQLEEGKIYHLTLNDNKDNITNLVRLDNQIPFGSPVTSSVIEGKVQAISKYSVTVDGNTYEFLESTKQYAINKAAGGASVSTATIAVDDNIIITLTENGYAQNLYKEKEIKDYTLSIEGEAGVRTLTNFFKIALSAVGHALYVYGGAWDFQDEGSSNQARSIGVADSWIEFFYEQNSSYSYKNSSNHAQTYYPFGSFNEYYYAGVDCSGYVGWIMYNVLNTESGNQGYVKSSTKMAKSFAELGLGTYTRDYSAPTSNVSDFKVGDIISMDGHVWICLGVCSDGSMVILHSTPSDSYSGAAGGGAQLSALGSSKECEAYKLADQYNKKYFKDWSDRYPTVLRSYSSYLSRNNTNCGKFSWYLNENGVLDPDNLSTMLPDQILKFLFNE